MRLTTVLALVVVSPCACETSRTYVRATGKAPSLVAAVHSQGQQLSRRRQRLTVLTVGAALCNDVLLVLMLVPMLPHLLPAGSSALALSFVFSAKDAAQLAVEKAEEDKVAAQQGMDEAQELLDAAQEAKDAAQEAKDAADEQAAAFVAAQEASEKALEAKSAAEEALQATRATAEAELKA